MTWKIAGVIVVSLIFFRTTWNASYVGCYADDAGYIFLAKALLAGKGYVNIWTPGEPPHHQFPPGFSLFLAPFTALVGEAFDQLKWVNIGVSSLAVLSCHFLFAPRLPRGWGWLLPVLVAGNFLIVNFAASVMSDPLFLLLTLLFFALLARYENLDVEHWGIGILLGMLAAAATGVRAIGIFLLVPLFLRGIRRRDAKILIGGFLPLTLMLLAASRYGWLGFYATGHHGAPLHFTLPVFLANAGYYPEILARLLVWHFPRLAPLTGPALLLLTLLVPVAVGLVLDWKRHGGSLGIYFLLYLLMVHFYRMQDPRLLLPIVPFLWYFFLKGISLLLENRRSALVGFGIKGALLMLLARGLLHFYPQHVRAAHLWNTPDLASFRWISDHSAPSDIVLTEAATRTYLFTRRRAIPITRRSEHFQILGFIYEQDVKFLYFTSEQLIPEATGEDVFGAIDYWTLARHDPGHFKPVFEHQDALRYSAIYEVLPRKESFLKSFRLTDRAARLYQENRLSEAGDLLGEALLLEPDFYLARNLLGMVLAESGHIEEAIDLLKKSISLFPFIERSHVALAYAYEKKGDPARAASSLRRALALATEQRHHHLVPEIRRELERLGGSPGDR